MTHLGQPMSVLFVMIQLLILLQVCILYSFSLHLTCTNLVISNTAEQEAIMTKEEEELLAEGKNFEHSAGSVTAGRIEILLRSQYLIASAYKYFETAGNKEVYTCIAVI